MSENGNGRSDIDAQELRLQVGVHDDPTEPVRAIIDQSQALRLETEDPAFMTVDGAGFWAWAKNENGDPREGPATRENLMAGLSRSDSLVVVDIEDTPIERYGTGGDQP